MRAVEQGIAANQQADCPDVENQNRSGKAVMKNTRIYDDREGNSLSVWFDDPKKEHVLRAIDDDVVLVKDRRGRVIGFERLNYMTGKQREQSDTISVEVQVV